MDPLQVPLTAAALLLVPSGAAKAARPGATLRAVRTVGLPASASAVRALGAAEVTIGAGVVLGGGRWWALALGLVYAAFTVFVVLALWRRAPIRSCGCFGDRGAPPSPLHVAVDAAVVAVAGLAVADPLPSALEAATDGLAEGVVLVVAAALLAAAGYAAFSRSPGTRAERSIPRPR